MTPIADIARLEETRQAVGVGEIADAALPLAGGWLCAGSPGSWMNQAVGMGLDGPVSDADLDALVGFYADRGVDAEVLVCPLAHRTLRDGLARRGFVLTGFENVLFRELDASLEGVSVAGLEVREVREDDPDDVTAWVDAGTCGFRPEGTAVPKNQDHDHRRLLAHPRMVGLVAVLDGHVVGGSALEVAGEVAALMATSVRSAFRRRGIQQALILHRLRRAWAAGARLATIQSEPGIPTERNARRLGFQVAYTRAVLRR